MEPFPLEELKWMLFVSPQNEKLTFERSCSEDSVNKLRKINSELRVGVD